MKIRFFSVLISVLCVVSMIAIPVFASESAVDFYEVEVFEPEEVITAIFDLAGVEEYDSSLVNEAIVNCSGEPLFISADHQIIVSDCVFFQNALAVFRNDADIYGFLPEEYYLDCESDTRYYVIPVSLSDYSVDGSEVLLTASYSGESSTVEPTSEPTSESSPELSSDTSLATLVDSDMISTVLDEILDILPVVVVVIIGFIALRKGISFVKGILHNG